MLNDGILMMTSSSCHTKQSMSALRLNSEMTFIYRWLVNVIANVGLYYHFA